MQKVRIGIDNRGDVRVRMPEGKKVVIQRPKEVSVFKPEAPSVQKAAELVIPTGDKLPPAKSSGSKFLKFFKGAAGILGVGLLAYGLYRLYNKLKSDFKVYTEPVAADESPLTEEDIKKHNLQVDSTTRTGAASPADYVAESWERKAHKILSKSENKDTIKQPESGSNEFTPEELAKIAKNDSIMRNRIPYETLTEHELAERIESQVKRPTWKDMKENSAKSKAADDKQTEKKSSDSKAADKKQTETKQSDKKSPENAKTEAKANITAQKAKPVTAKSEVKQDKTDVKPQQKTGETQDFIIVKKGDCLWNIIKKDLVKNPDKYSAVREDLTKKLGKKPSKNQIINEVCIRTSKKYHIGDNIRPGNKIKIAA